MAEREKGFNPERMPSEEVDVTDLLHESAGPEAGGALAWGNFIDKLAQYNETDRLVLDVPIGTLTPQQIKQFLIGSDARSIKIHCTLDEFGSLANTYPKGKVEWIVK